MVSFEAFHEKYKDPNICADHEEKYTNKKGKRVLTASRRDTDFFSRIFLIALIVCGIIMFTACGSKDLDDTVSESEIETQVKDGGQAQAEDAQIYEAGANISRALEEKSQTGSGEEAELTTTEGITLPKTEKDYTIMVYMIGSNLESRYASATSDIEEMEAAGLDFTKNNVLVYTGGSRRWNNDVPAKNNSILDLSLEKNSRIVASTASNANMGTPETLTSFVNYARENYPAKHYGIIFWDHGAGPLWGYGSDELYGNDSLLLDEMIEAMNATDFNYKNKLDFVGFDACLMGSLETMTIWSQYADYYVGSEELEPGSGWNYAFLSILNDTTDTKTIVQKIVEAYGEYYEAARTETSNPDVTLACADLSKVTQVQNALAGLSKDMTGDLNKGAYAQLQRDRSTTKSFGLVESSKGGTFAYDLMDLGDFAAVLEDSYPKKSKQIQEAVDDLIISQYSNIKNTSGVTVYYPYNNKAQFSEMSSTYNRLNINVQYTNFLNQLTSTWLRSRTREWEVPEAKIAEDGISMQLTEDMVDNVTEIYYYIIQKMEDGSYYPLVLKNKVTMDKEGNVTLPVDPDLFYMTLNTGDEQYWPVSQVESGSDRAVWHAENMRLTNNIHTGFEINDSEYQDVDVMMEQNLINDEITIQSVSSDEGDASLGGKNTVEVGHYEGVYWYYAELLPTRDKMGRLLPINQWGRGDSTGHYMVPVDDGSLSFVTRKASEYLGDLYYQVVIEDENGEAYASEMIPIKPENKVKTVKENTEQGTITYAIYDDHAEVYDYYGQDTKIEVKSEIEGQKVTEINGGAFGRVALFETYNHNLIEEITLPETITSIGIAAFQNCRELKEIDLPEALTSIGSDAFAGCSGLTEVEIPDTVEIIGKGAFSYCGSLEKVKLPGQLKKVGTQIFMRTALKELTLDTSNKNYKIQDGMLLSADGKYVYGAALLGRDKIDVPEGVEYITSGAFYGPYSVMKEIKELSLPSSLKFIGNFAFADMIFAKAPELPKKLEYIGMYAFNASDYSLTPEEIPEEQSVISIGDQVKYVGIGAFDMFNNRRFKVAEDNLYYAELDGCMTNEAKDTLTEIAYQSIETIVIPEGILSFDVNYLENYGIIGFFDLDHVDVFFPESVNYIEDKGAILSWDYFVFHCDPDSAAGIYALAHGIEISQEDEVQTGKTEVSTPHGTMTFALFGSHASLVKYEGTDAAIEVPDTVEGKPVTTIGNGHEAIQTDADLWVTEADENGECDSLLEIVLPETVTVLRDKAFQFMALKKMNIPDHLVYLGARTVPSAITLSELPDSVEHMGSECIQSVNSFKEDGFIIPESLTYMAPDALCECNISEYKIKNENENYSVKDGVLYAKDGKTLISWPRMKAGEAVIPDGVTVIGPMAFAKSKVTKVSFPDTIEKIQDSAFYYCWDLEEVQFGKGLETIEANAFKSCDKLEEVILPESVRSIGDYCFGYCDQLKRLVLNEGLRTTGEHIIDGAESLETIVIPQSLTGVADYAFGSFGEGAYVHIEDDTIKLGNNFSALGNQAFGMILAKDYEVAEDNPYFATVDGWLTDASGTVLMGCPAGRTGEVHVPDSIYRIEGFTFYGCSQVTDVYIPDSVGSISSLAFDDDLYKTWVSATDTETSGFVKDKDVVIHCSKGSAAEQFCRDEKLTYVIE